MNVPKYRPLQDWLTTAPRGVEVTFEQIGDLVGGLPPTAYRRPQWWSNNADRHVQAMAWLDAGRRVGWVDLEMRRVRFD